MSAEFMQAQWRLTMAAKIIPFPGFMQRHFTRNLARQMPNAMEESREWDSADGIHLVGTAGPGSQEANAEARRDSQQEAFRIVQEVQQEWNDSHPARRQQVSLHRPPGFWKTIPLPLPERETPLTVARRLMHMLLSDARTA
jgi:hypothetical protein